METIKEAEGRAVTTGERGIVVIDTSVWMRPKTACEYLKERGIKVSYSLMNYWKNNDKIESTTIKELDDLTLVNIKTIPEELRVKQKIK